MLAARPTLSAKDLFSAIARGGDLSGPEALWLIDELEAREPGCVLDNPRLCAAYEIRVINSAVRPHAAQLFARKVLSREARSHALDAIRRGLPHSDLLARLIIVHCDPAVHEFAALRTAVGPADFADLLLTTPAVEQLEEFAGYLEVLDDASPYLGVKYLLERDEDAVVELLGPRLLSPAPTRVRRTTDEERRLNLNFIYVNSAMALVRRFAHLSRTLLDCGDEIISQAVAYETADEDTQRRAVRLPVLGDPEEWFSGVRGVLDALIHNPALSARVRRELRAALCRLPTKTKRLPEVRRARRATSVLHARPSSVFWMERYRERGEGVKGSLREDEWQWDGLITRGEAESCTNLILQHHLELLAALADGWCGTPLELVETAALLGAGLLV